MNWTAVFCALVSAALFGASTPAAKALVGSVHPAMLAGPKISELRRGLSSKIISLGLLERMPPSQ
jgi:hypothetical protein